MILFPNFGQKGRLGNQLFQLASLIGMKYRYETRFGIPEWSYAGYFQSKHEDNPFYGSSTISEPHFYHDWKWLDDHRETLKDGWVNVDGWLQSEKYFEHCIPQVRRALSFEPSFIKHVEDDLPQTGRQRIAISIRRGLFDKNHPEQQHGYVGNPNYAQLSIDYYLKALYAFFPEWRHYDLILFSDDPKYLEIHFEGVANTYIYRGDAISQLAAMSTCDHFIIANSTFSWWGAWLGEKPHTKVICPVEHFAGALSVNDTKDYYPERWVKFDYKKAPKFDLKDVTFTIPVHFDHQDRHENVTASIWQLQSMFDTNIIVGEQGGDHFKLLSVSTQYVNFDYPDFHRTRMLNEMAKLSDTSFIVNWDADVFVPPMQILQAMRLLRENHADVIYPYDGRFARVPRDPFYRLMSQHNDVGMFNRDFELEGQDPEFAGTKEGEKLSVGGAIFFNKNSFFEGGGENEYMISYAPEDTERFERFMRLGFDTRRVKGIIYHLDHFVGINSSYDLNPYMTANRLHLQRERELSDEDLRKVVQSWPWANPYSDDYHESITQSAIRSSERVYEVLKMVLSSELDLNKAQFLDIGCGLGQWGVKCPGEYRGIDYRVPVGKLLIPEEKYTDYDLVRYLKQRNYDYSERDRSMNINLCLEVAEHIDESLAEPLVKTLCDSADYVLFSAAIPGQGGNHHVNEQWQSWWAKLFEKQGFYQSITPMRDMLMVSRNSEVDVWYRQNMVLYQKPKYEGRVGPAVTDYVDPEMFTNHITK